MKTILASAFCLCIFRAVFTQTNPPLDNLPDNTWLKMTPSFDPPGLDFNGFGHPKTESKLVFDEKDSVAVWFGGCSNGYTNSTWLYSVTRNTWTEANCLTYLQGGVEQCGPMNYTEKNCNSLPVGQCHYSIAYDSDSGVCVKHTGIESGWTAPDMNTWSYDAGLKKWTRLIAMGIGNASIQAMAYDRETRRTVLYGCLSGYCGAEATTTYAFNMVTKTWTNRSTANPPSSRGWASMAYHQKLKKTVLFGGASYYGPVKNDTWLYDYTANTWTQINPSNPPPARTRGSMAYDSRNGVMILTCGNDTCYGAGSGAGTWLRDTWVLDVQANTWTEMHPALQPVCGEKTWQPAYDPVNNVMVVVDQNSGTWVYRYKNPGPATAAKRPPAPPQSLEASPNPFNPVTTLSFSGLPGVEDAQLVIVDVKGNKVADLTDRIRGSGATWDAQGKGSGLYFAVLKSGRRTFRTKLALLK